MFTFHNVRKAKAEKHSQEQIKHSNYLKKKIKCNNRVLCIFDYLY